LNQTCTGSLKSCVFTHFWAGGTCADYGENTITYRLTSGGETNNFTAPFSLLHGTYSGVEPAPFSAGSLFGITGKPSGMWNTIEIPFTDHAEVSVRLRKGCGHLFWIIVRGHNQAYIGPQRQLASQLTIRSNYVPMSVVPQNKVHSMLHTSTAGRLLYTVLAVSFPLDQGTHFLEGCVRWGNKTDPQQELLSSGTEDYFLGTYYFNQGIYANGVAGLTVFDRSAHKFSAYRVFDKDLFEWEAPEGTEPFNLTWRNNDPAGCNLNKPSTFHGADVNASTLAVWYDVAEH